MKVFTLILFVFMNTNYSIFTLATVSNLCKKVGSVYFMVVIEQNKITLYKTVIKPVWTYGIQLWGAASNSNIEILQRFRSKMLRSLINVPWYVTNETIHRDLKISTIKDEIRNSRSKYNARVNNHHNPLVTQLLDTTDQVRRLKRKYPLD